MKKKAVGTMFTNQMLVKLIVPLVLEQILGVLVGMADTVMVSSVGETAVSGVSLVDTINVLFFTIFSALATGGSVVAAHFVGQKNNKKASQAGNQLFRVSLIAGLAIMLLCLFGNRFLLKWIFGDIEPEVMENAMTYFMVLSFSFPFMACYNSCAALFRVMGNSKISLYCSLVMNGVNIGGNWLLLYVVKMGVAGVALASTVSRMAALIIMVVVLAKPGQIIVLERKISLRLRKDMVRKILQIGIPNGLETGVFQIGKVLVLSLVTSFGTMSITANAVGNTIGTFQNMAGGAIGLAMITVVGQCIGAGEYEQAKYYGKKLLGIAYLAMFVTNLIALLGVIPFLEPIFHLSPETAVLARRILLISAAGAMLIWPLSFTLPNALRAAGDVNYAMVVSIVSMWVWRVGFSVILGKYFGLGLTGVWISMIADWICRGTCFFIRFRRGKWVYGMTKKA